MPDAGLTDGVTEYDAAFHDTYVRQQVVTQCTSSTRPTNIDGRIITQDTGEVLLGDGTNWIVLAEPTQTYTPTFTNCSGGTATGFYKRSDGWVDVFATYTFAGAGVAGAVTLSLPKTMANANRLDMTVNFLDDGTSNRMGRAVATSTTTVTIVALNTTGTYIGDNNLSSTVPFTWANLDRIEVSARYQMANRYD